MTPDSLDIIRLASNNWKPGFQNDSIWKNVAGFDRFRLWWNPDEPEPRTSIKMFHDGNRLCFRYEATEDDTVVLAEPLADKMDVIREGRVEIFMEAEPDMARYYCLEIDPLGRALDYKAAYYRMFQREWTFPNLALAGRITPYGYEVEGAVELDVLRSLDILKEDNTMRAGLYRAAFRHGRDASIIERWACWINPQTDEPDFHVPTSLGTLRVLP